MWWKFTFWYSYHFVWVWFLIRYLNKMETINLIRRGRLVTDTCWVGHFFVSNQEISIQIMHFVTNQAFLCSMGFFLSNECYIVINNTLILGIWCSTIPHLPGCFCPWTFFENIGFHTVLTDPFMSHLATQLGCRGVSGFATDCPCGVWCRGLTTWLLHVGPPFGNRILNNSWAVGLTKWIINFIFCV